MAINTNTANYDPSDFHPGDSITVDVAGMRSRFQLVVCRVVKVTRSGQLIAENADGRAYRFNRYGYEITSKGKFCRAQALSNELAAYLVEQQAVEARHGATRRATKASLEVISKLDPIHQRDELVAALGELIGSLENAA